MAPDARREVDRLAEEMQAVIEIVRREIRGRPIGEAQKHLENALRARGFTLPKSQARNLARHMADPWWPIKHPIGFLREIQEARREPRARRGSNEARDEDMDELAARLEDVPELRSIKTPDPPTDGAVYIVTIDPWSKRVERLIHAKAAPHKVVVVREL